MFQKKYYKNIKNDFIDFGMVLFKPQVQFHLFLGAGKML